MSVIKHFDVVEHIGPGLRPCLIVTPMDPFPFEQGEETFCHGVIVTIPSPTHAARDALIPKQFLEIAAGILTATIGVMNETRYWWALSYGYLEGLQDQVALKPRPQAPPHHFPRIEVEHDG